jgi:hypothetical protein
VFGKKKNDPQIERLVFVMNALIAAIQQLSTDIQTLLSGTPTPAQIAAATAAVAQIDATVQAAIGAPAPAAPAAPAAPVTGTSGNTTAAAPAAPAAAAPQEMIAPGLPKTANVTR